MTSPPATNSNLPAQIVPEQPRTIQALLESDSARKQIEPLIPRGLTYEQIMQEVYFAVKDNPDILTCEGSSIIRSVGRAVMTGLEIGKKIHLVPFRVNVAKKGQPDRYEKRCQVIRDYKGDIELILAVGGARSINAKCFYEAEVTQGRFRYWEGDNPRVDHQPIIEPSARGPMAGAYAIARINAYAVKILCMSIKEIDAIRRQYSKQWKGGDCPPWYAKKTVIHQIAKELPTTPKLRAVLAQFGAGEAPLELGDAETELTRPESAGPGGPPIAVVDPEIEAPTGYATQAAHCSCDPAQDFPDADCPTHGLWDAEGDR